jgi:energy-coupling factor transporter ATP-binding protein EcfA2
MLIEFSVSNYRSFREKQTLSMVATPRLSKKRNVIKAPLTGEKFPGLLKVAAIYGPNASGKSSLMQALGIMHNLILKLPSVIGDSLPVKTFRFDSGLTGEPSEFEYHFIREGVRYQFVLGLTEERITEERLLYYPKGKESVLYERHFEGGREVYKFGELLEGGKEVHEAWRKLTSPKTLFLAQAVVNSSEDLKQLRVPFGWFKSGLWIVEQDSMRSWSKVSFEVLKKVPDFTGALEGFLQETDIPVSSIRLEEADNVESPALSLEKKTASSSHAEKRDDKATFTHVSLLGNAEFDFSEESGGTKNLIGFWLPWMTMNFLSPVGTGILAVDELDSSLHPEIVASILDKHLESELNTQLIFTTHDTHLMNTKILRRDQFWITERDANGATKLFSIHDFEGREGEDVEKRYFEGRYRGLPLIRRR